VFLLYFWKFGFPGAGRWGGVVACLAALGAAGCNQLLLQSTPTVSAAPDGGDAAIAAPITRDSHTIYFPIGDGTNHAEQICSDCHQSDGGSFTDYTCVSCHDHSEQLAQQRHAHINGFVYESSACFSCHPTGNEAPITADEHSLQFFPINDDAHGSLQCSDCHQDPTTSATYTCIACHDHGEDVEATNHAGLSGYSYDSKSCFSCHSGTTAATD
jgi:hypothetical protein